MRKESGNDSDDTPRTEPSVRITKIKAAAGGAVITLLETLNENDAKDVVFRSADKPHPVFDEALQALGAAVRTILGLPADWAKDSLKVTSVSFSKNKDTNVKGAVISGQVNLTTANSPFFFSTPHLPFEQYGENGDAPLMPIEAQQLLDTVEIEAWAYIKGKRAQGELPLGA